VPTKTNISELAREAGLSPKVVHNRLTKGWTLENALNTPLGGGAKRGRKKKVAKKVMSKPMVAEARTVEKFEKDNFDKTVCVVTSTIVGFLIGAALGLVQ
jgi:hypothetical protein